MAGKWSLEGELLERTGHSSVEQALRSLGMLPEEAEFVAITTSSNWVRGGSETYIYTFDVLAMPQWSRRFILKAGVAFSPGLTAGEVVERWVRRRLLMQEAGVRVPRLYGVHKATILEEYVPFEVERLLVSRAVQDAIVEGLVRYSAALTRLGFRSVAPFSDLRSFGEDVVPVDFGTDLGEPGDTSGDVMYSFGQLVNWLRRLKVELPTGAEDDYISLLRPPP